jgi:predicted metal-dependent hydrolase
VPPDRWRENPTYLFGVDLYNHAYWWECHEALEALWHLTGHRGTEAAFLQGLIQAAAANLKRHMGSAEGARRLGREAVDRLRSVGAERFMGVDLPRLVRELEARHVSETSEAVPLISLQ